MEDGIAKLIAAEDCVGDENCVAACPLSAIRMEPVAG
jgi:NAD-dependent dihydropyrimidine dehydrogenase PreA subunit